MSRWAGMSCYKIQNSRFNKHLFVINIYNIKFTDNKILTEDPYKGTYIEPLSQRPPNNSTFLKAVLRYVQANYNVHACSRLIYNHYFIMYYLTYSNLRLMTLRKLNQSTGEFLSL